MERVQEHSLLRDFRLESGTGEIISPMDFRGRRNLVIVFFDPGCEQCRRFLSNTAERYGDYTDLNTEVLAVGEAGADQLRTLANSMGLPFIVLADPDGCALSRYAQSVPATFVADRYGEVRLAYSGMEADHFPDQEVILSQLDLAELECPECGAPTWFP
ncbi:MAG: redoxin domain-containing protein [Armatimonadetes bacterium]|nr:redoxin domain-containing protein [Armatimonadota bacterium]